MLLIIIIIIIIIIYNYYCRSNAEEGKEVKKNLQKGSLAGKRAYKSRPTMNMSKFLKQEYKD